MPADRKPALIVALIAMQIVSAVFFLSDLLKDSVQPGGSFGLSTHLLVETAATIGLIFGIIVEVLYIRDQSRRTAALERNLRVATGALNDVIVEYFRDWGLTPSESDVAMFAIKGMTNTEIAGLRDSSEGTIKAHLNAVFRKAGVSGRNQLVSLLVEDLMARPLVGAVSATP